MNLDAVIAELHLDPALKPVLDPHWDASMATLASWGGHRPEALDYDFFGQDRVFCGLSDTVDDELKTAAKAIAANPALKCLFWHFLQSVYVHPRGVKSAEWPDFDAQLNGRGGLFYLLAGLAMIPMMQAKHQSLGIPAEVTQDTAQQVRCFCDEMFRRGNDGKAGIFRSQAYWFRNYTDGWLYRLGRMEYMLRPFGGYVEVFRQAATGRTVALAMPGFHVTPAGFVVSAEEAASAGGGPSCWVTTRADTADAFVGAPVSPQGFIEHRELRLPKSAWQRVLGPGDLSMEMHIPAGGAMPPDVCKDSLERGFVFFAKYFPNQPVRATSCQSWIFNTQLFEILPADANLNRFMRELYLFPIVAGPQSGLFFLFFQDRDLHFATLPETTRVQRAVKQYLLRGHRWRSGGMFFLKDDLPQFGREHYRTGAATKPL